MISQLQRTWSACPWSIHPSSFADNAYPIQHLIKSIPFIATIAPLHATFIHTRPYQRMVEASTHISELYFPINTYICIALMFCFHLIQRWLTQLTGYEGIITERCFNHIGELLKNQHSHNGVTNTGWYRTILQSHRAQFKGIECVYIDDVLIYTRWKFHLWCRWLFEFVTWRNATNVRARLRIYWNEMAENNNNIR